MSGVLLKCQKIPFGFHMASTPCSALLEHHQHLLNCGRRTRAAPCVAQHWTNRVYGCAALHSMLSCTQERLTPCRSYFLQYC